MKERDFIEKIKSLYKAKTEMLTIGIGDDCAVFAESDELCWIISTDLLVENVHFSLKWHDPYLLGRKSIAVNLSDIAAMGGKPRFVLLSVSIPPYLTTSWFDKFNEGVRAILQEYNCVLIGGDTTKGSSLIINITILGTCVPQEVVYRSGASPHQDIYVTGPLGSAAAGLALLNNGLKVNDEFVQLYQAHFNPDPQVFLGSILGKSKKIVAMQDISDGLSTDLSHICKASKIGAIIYSEKLPYDAKLENVCDLLKIELWDLVLHGGEDYQLVFISSTENREKIKEMFAKNRASVFRVGYTEEEQGVFLVDEKGQKKEITFKGFEHTS